MQSETRGPIRVTQLDRVCVVEFSEKDIVSPHTIEQAQDRLMELAETLEPPRVVLSFRGVSHISSSMIGTLINVHRACEAGRGELRLCDLSKDILQVFKITKLHKLMNIDKTLKDATKKLG